jgi:hypothetical protein
MENNQPNQEAILKQELEDKLNIIDDAIEDITSKAEGGLSFKVSHIKNVGRNIRKLSSKPDEDLFLIKDFGIDIGGVFHKAVKSSVSNAINYTKVDFFSPDTCKILISSLKEQKNEYKERFIGEKIKSSLKEIDDTEEFLKSEKEDIEKQLESKEAYIKELKTKNEKFNQNDYQSYNCEAENNQVEDFRKKIEERTLKYNVIYNLAKELGYKNNDILKEFKEKKENFSKYKKSALEELEGKFSKLNITSFTEQKELIKEQIEKNSLDQNLIDAWKNRPKIKGDYDIVDEAIENAIKKDENKKEGKRKLKDFEDKISSFMEQGDNNITENELEKKLKILREENDNLDNQFDDKQIESYKELNKTLNEGDEKTKIEELIKKYEDKRANKKQEINKKIKDLVEQMSQEKEEQEKIKAELILIRKQIKETDAEEVKPLNNSSDLELGEKLGEKLEENDNNRKYNLEKLQKNESKIEELKSLRIAYKNLLTKTKDQGESEEDGTEKEISEKIDLLVKNNSLIQKSIDQNQKEIEEYFESKILKVTGEVLSNFEAKIGDIKVKSSDYINKFEDYNQRSEVIKSKFDYISNLSKELSKKANESVAKINSNIKDYFPEYNNPRNTITAKPKGDNYEEIILENFNDYQNLNKDFEKFQLEADSLNQEMVKECFLDIDKIVKEIDVNRILISAERKKAENQQEEKDQEIKLEEEYKEAKKKLDLAKEKLNISEIEDLQKVFIEIKQSQENILGSLSQKDLGMLSRNLLIFANQGSVSEYLENLRKIINSTDLKIDESSKSFLSQIEKNIGNKLGKIGINQLHNVDLAVQEVLKKNNEEDQRKSIQSLQQIVKRHSDANYQENEKNTIINQSLIDTIRVANDNLKKDKSKLIEQIASSQKLNKDEEAKKLQDQFEEKEKKGKWLVDSCNKMEDYLEKIRTISARFEPTELRKPLEDLKTISDKLIINNIDFKEEDNSKKAKEEEKFLNDVIVDFGKLNSESEKKYNDDEKEIHKKIIEQLSGRLLSLKDENKKNDQKKKEEDNKNNNNTKSTFDKIRENFNYKHCALSIFVVSLSIFSGVGALLIGVFVISYYLKDKENDADNNDDEDNSKNNDATTEQKKREEFLKTIAGGKNTIKENLKQAGSVDEEELKKEEKQKKEGETQQAQEGGTKKVQEGKEKEGREKEGENQKGKTEQEKEGENQKGKTEQEKEEENQKGVAGKKEDLDGIKKAFGTNLGSKNINPNQQSKNNLSNQNNRRNEGAQP